MKKIFTFLFLLSPAILLFAAEPTVSSSSFVFSNIEGSKITVRYTSGNGSSRIVVMKAGSPVTGLPVNGSDYSFNQNFGAPSAAFTAANEYVVWKGVSNTFTVSNLQPNTIYYLAVFDYNGTTVSTQYLMTALTGLQSTAVTPATQANSISFTAVTGNSVRINWQNGSGEGRLVVARKASAVNGTPTDLIDYLASSDYSVGDNINGDNYVVYKNSGNNVTLNKLEPNTSYHFSIFERNGSAAPVYLRPGATASITTLAGPTVQTQSLSFSGQEGNRFAISCVRGNGAKRLYIIKKGSPVTAVPVNGQQYLPNTGYGLGEQIAAEEFVINSSSEAAVIVTNLDPATTYYFRSFEYDEDAAGNKYYLTTNPASGSFSTASAPTPPTALNYINVTGNSLTLRYTAGSGAYRMVLIKQGSPVDASPATLTRYTGNTSFGNGTELGSGNFVANGGGNGTSTNVSNLQPGATYHFAVYEFSGNNYPVYSASPALSSITLPAEPTVIATAFTKTLIEGNSFRAGWQNGNGTHRIVVARKGSAVTATPVDGSIYTSSNQFGQGSAIAPGQFVVYDGVGSSADIRNLDINSTYHLAVYEYNLSGTSPDYLTSTWLAGNASTLAAPSTQVSAVNASNIQSNSASFSFVPGNGNARLFVMRQGSAVDVDPVNFTSYSSNTVFGTVKLGDDNFIVQKTITGSNFTVTGLNPSTQYYMAVFEFNGVSGPVYLLPAFTMSFTTAAGAEVVAPTLPASVPVFSNIEGNKINFRWDIGNGANRIVVARQGTAVNFVPTNGVAYAPDATFGNGTDLGNNQYVIYNGTGNNFTVSNLLPASVYHFAVYEYNGSGVNTRYLTSSFLASNSSTLNAPSAGSSNPVTGFTSNSITLSWQNGTGSARLVVVKEEAIVSATPANLTLYPANAVFRSGAQLATGEFAVYAGSGNTVTVTGLDKNKTYHYKVFEYNGSTGPVYNTSDPLTGSITTSSVLPVTWLYFKAGLTQNKVAVTWGTATEQKSAYFVVERNGNNKGFIALDTLVGAGDSPVARHYAYTDENAEEGNNHYRIKQVDIDGRFTYSRTVNVSIAGKQGFQLYPNPGTANVRVKLYSNNSKVTLLIYDLKGTLVQQQVVNNNDQLHTTKLQPGVYYIVVQDGQTKYSGKFVKL